MNKNLCLRERNSYGCLNAANLGICKLANSRILIFLNFDSQ